MKVILQGWNFMRILRLALATGILIQGIASGDMVSIIIGVVFGGMALANIGCCGTSGCAINPRATGNKSKGVEFEEVLNKNDH